MENILFATNAYHIDENTLDFACYIALSTGSKLKGVFLENSLNPAPPVVERMQTIDENTSMVTAVQATGVETRQELCEKNIAFFEEYCRQKGVRYCIHRDRNEPLYELLTESRFADLIIIDEKTSFDKKQGYAPSHFVKQLLQEAECPVLLGPECHARIDTIVFAYDGSASSVHAIKQFIHLFPCFEDKKVLVVEVNSDGKLVKDKHRIAELLKGHYSKIGYEVLQGDPAGELFGFLLNRTGCMVVMGAFGRNYLSTLLKKSTGEIVLRSIPMPIFIAHV